MEIRTNTGSRTLQLSRPAGRVFFRALLILVIFLAGFEILLRLLVGSGLIINPGPSTNNADLNTKLPLLDKLAAETHIDCIFLGSSMTNDGIDPEVFSQRYAELSGRQLTCFNFGVGWLTGEVAGGLSRILVDRYHPDVLIYGTSARDYSAVMGMRALKSDPWYQYMLGQWNLPGWLQEHSMLYRYYLKFLSDLNPSNRGFAIKTRDHISPYGHFRLDIIGEDLEAGNRIDEEELRPKDFNGFSRLVKLKSDQLQVVVIEIPVHMDYLPVYVNNSLDQYYELFYDEIEEVTSRNDVPLINTVTGGLFTSGDDGWGDMKHLNVIGAERFSLYLAEAAWQLEQDGRLELGTD